MRATAQWAQEGQERTGEERRYVLRFREEEKVEERKKRKGNFCHQVSGA